MGAESVGGLLETEPRRLTQSFQPGGQNKVRDGPAGSFASHKHLPPSGTYRTSRNLWIVHTLYLAIDARNPLYVPIPYGESHGPAREKE
ncbi:hypothetical protein GCM10010449_33340 [Streptomyces rectiviolaceus]|uniref:Transposase n=1 Tax=Streptomyces rectiviolaceus TaxID=332591 RepID=A0ABP6MGF4_9ACTN